MAQSEIFWLRVRKIACIVLGYMGAICWLRNCPDGWLACMAAIMIVWAFYD
jgi:hypothetical protein